MATALANDWFVVEVLWRGLSDERVFHLSGISTGHRHIPNGHRFISTPLQWLDQTNQQAQTRNTLYRLGPEITAEDVRAVDLQRIKDYLDGLWIPPKSSRLVLTIPRSLANRNRT